MPGVYELADENKRIIYIGQSAKDVPNRIRQHLEKNSCTRQLAYWRYAYSRIPQAEEAVLIADYLARHGHLPLCNRARPQTRGAERRFKERSRKL